LKKAEDGRVEKPPAVEPGPAFGRLAGGSACPTLRDWFFMEFRGRNAHTNRPQKTMVRPTGRYRAPRDNTRDFTAWNMMKVSMPKDMFLM